jgi:RimJ/RimL family protein N-acetyltransferase
VSFRPAAISDAPLLYRWRQQAEEAAFWRGDPVDYQAHLRWLARRVDHPLVRLLIWEDDGEPVGPVGTVRIDSNGELAFHAETDAAAHRMLDAAHQYAADHGGRLKASVDQADREKIRQLQQAGFEKYPVVFLAYRP